MCLHLYANLSTHSKLSLFLFGTPIINCGRFSELKFFLLCREKCCKIHYISLSYVIAIGAFLAFGLLVRQNKRCKDDTLRFRKLWSTIFWYSVDKTIRQLIRKLIGRLIDYENNSCSPTRNIHNVLNMWVHSHSIEVFCSIMLFLIFVWYSNTCILQVLSSYSGCISWRMSFLKPPSSAIVD